MGLMKGKGTIHDFTSTQVNQTSANYTLPVLYTKDKASIKCVVDLNIKVFTKSKHYS